MAKSSPSSPDISEEVLIAREAIRRSSTKDPLDQLIDFHLIIAMADEARRSVIPQALKALRQVRRKAHRDKNADTTEFSAVKGAYRFRVSLDDKESAFYDDKNLLHQMRNLRAMRKEARQRYLGRNGHEPGQIDPDAFTVNVEVR